MLLMEAVDLKVVVGQTRVSDTISRTALPEIVKLVGADVVSVLTTLYLLNYSWLGEVEVYIVKSLQ